MTRPQNKHLKANPQTLGVVPLEKGEATRVVRVRTRADALDWFAGLTAEERGALVAKLYAEKETPP